MEKKNQQKVEKNQKIKNGLLKKEILQMEKHCWY